MNEAGKRGRVWRGGRYYPVLKITGGHWSISDQFAHMTMQLALEPVIWSDHSYCSIN